MKMTLYFPFVVSLIAVTHMCHHVCCYLVISPESRNQVGGGCNVPVCRLCVYIICSVVPRTVLLCYSLASTRWCRSPWTWCSRLQPLYVPTAGPRDHYAHARGPRVCITLGVALRYLLRWEKELFTNYIQYLLLPIVDEWVRGRDSGLHSSIEPKR
jgi:hypothetical protein